MNIEYKDFIGFFRNVFPDGYCKHLISEFERLDSLGAGTSRLQGENVHRHIKDDQNMFMTIKAHAPEPFDGFNTTDMFFKGLQACYEEYTKKYSVLRDAGTIRATTMKVQRTGPGGGYHVWHCEQGNGESANRVISYMLYLNTLADEEYGETEFLYQQQRVRTEENLMVFWPAAYTHAHRGNPVYGQNYKYIVTGWFYHD